MKKEIELISRITTPSTGALSNPAPDCDCRSSITEKLAERFKAAQPQATDHKVELQGYGFGVVGNTMVMRPYMAYKASADYPLKKGGTKWKTLTGNMVFSFCPFCGSKFRTGDAP